MQTFLKSLKAKLLAKSALYPEKISVTGFDELENFHQYDERYTAPLHGFASADEYWSRCSSKFLVDKICLPTLILSARDDPFLSSSCVPIEQAQRNSHIQLETPSHGGHVGFMSKYLGKFSYAEQRILEFVSSLDTNSLCTSHGAQD